jgi:uncharacterized membrane protein
MSPLLRIQPAALVESLRKSLVFIPSLCILFGAALAHIAPELDRRNTWWIPANYETTPDNARAVLSVIATGTITVVTLLLTLTLVAIQLAAAQLSPRTISSFLGDRFQQATVGVVLGTATFSLLSLRSIPARPGADAQSADLTIMLGVLAAITSLVMVVLSVDRTANRLTVGTLINDLVNESLALIERDHPLPNDDSADKVAPDGAFSAVTTIYSDQSGWVQYVDHEALLNALPDGARARLHHPVGSFVYVSMPLIELNEETVDEGIKDQLRSGVVVGDQRTGQQDVSYGLTRLTDVGLRALSPGVNDPNTARESVLRQGEILLQLLARDLPPRTHSVDYKLLELTNQPNYADFVCEAFDQLRLAATNDRATLETMKWTLDMLVDESTRRALPGALDEVERQLGLVEQRLSEGEWG